MFKTYKCHLDYLWLFAGNPFNMIRVLAVHQEPPGIETDSFGHHEGIRVQAHVLKALSYEDSEIQRGVFYEEA
ncbi:hypothetical protein [Paenibacillus sp. Y412MC10]|uniref:hypothetical protein n=1 Tax=Geobacillus sp. (strain Y412MC10) TaxID=481743 RepID=UPI0011A2470A|nr:hypothetical protein [Paenibacillus sp. Y412MC10]